MTIINFGKIAIRRALLEREKKETDQRLTEVANLPPDLIGVMNPRERRAYRAYPEGCLCHRLEGKGYCGWCDAYYSGEGA